MVQGDTCVTTVHSRQIEDPSGGDVVGVDQGWRDRAACRSVDPELFFPVGDDGPGLVQIAQAKAVCAACPVVAACLSFALVALPEGVAGGLTVEERRGLQDQHGVCGWTAADAAGSAQRSAGGVDGQVVASLMAGEPVSGASREELAQAAVGLHLAGHRAGWVATRLGVGERQVHRWLQRYRAGKPLIATRRGPRGAVAS